jgi:hypothetical protein
MISTVSFNRMVRWALASIARSISSSTTIGTHSRGSWRLQLQLQKKKNWFPCHFHCALFLQTLWMEIVINFIFSFFQSFFSQFIPYKFS